MAESRLIKWGRFGLIPLLALGAYFIDQKILEAFNVKSYSLMAISFNAAVLTLTIFCSGWLIISTHYKILSLED